MNFSKLIHQRNIFLIPFSWLYQAGVFIYHRLFDKKILKSFHPDVTTICVGNLSVGGTGKSPMVEYLLRLLHDKWLVAVVSRGYKRKSKGFVLATEDVTATDIGDEPMQFYKKFPDVRIAVGEKRADTITRLCEKYPDIDVIILDDAFQHRAVTPHFNILLTDANHLFPDDGYLPAGSLRDLKSNYRRANLIVVTKCDNSLSEEQREQMIAKINPPAHQHVFFTDIIYGNAYNIFSGENVDLKNCSSLLVVTGIARPKPLIQHLKSMALPVLHLSFDDHHHFSAADIKNIIAVYQTIPQKNKVLLTTEKDAARLATFSELKDLSVVALPIQHQFLFNEADAFDAQVLKFLNNHMGSQPSPVQ